MNKVIDTEKYEYYLNRDTSLIEFNRRVLLEAEGNKHPLLERLKFISILSANLDEFFMITVAGLKTLIAAGIEELSYDGKTPQQQLTEIREKLLPIWFANMGTCLLVSSFIQEEKRIWGKVDEREESFFIPLQV